MSTTSYETTRQALARRTGETLNQKISPVSETWSRAERRIAINLIKALASGEELEVSLMQQTPRVWIDSSGMLLAYCDKGDCDATRLPGDKVQLIHDAFSEAYAESLDPADALY